MTLALLGWRSRSNPNPNPNMVGLTSIFNWGQFYSCSSVRSDFAQSGLCIQLCIRYVLLKCFLNSKTWFLTILSCCTFSRTLVMHAHLSNIALMMWQLCIVWPTMDLHTMQSCILICDVILSTTITDIGQYDLAWWQLFSTVVRITFCIFDVLFFSNPLSPNHEMSCHWLYTCVVSPRLPTTLN